MKCPYQIDADCRYIDASTMTTEKSCEECELYNNGIYMPGCEKRAFVLAVMIIILLILIIR